MVDVINNRCEHPGCMSKPNFNLPGERYPIFCSKHVTSSKMINIMDTRLCVICNKVRQTYGYEGDIATHCKTHALDGMINVVSDMCKDDCGTVACYNLPGTKKGIYCDVHKKPGMVDVRNSKCTDCGINASFGFPTKKPVKCRQHAEHGMISNPRKKCNIDMCKQYAIYGTYGHERCFEHKQKNDINFAESVCSSCGLLEILSESLCRYCDPETGNFVALAKQREVKAFLDTLDIKYTTYDRRIDSGICGNERPDFVFETLTHTVILEVDEGQHKHILRECEITRMKNISQTIGRTTMFIRYNPDRYRVDGKVINKSQKNRFDVLSEWLHFLIGREQDNLYNYGLLSVFYLFYDNFDENHVDTIVLTPYE
jgi:hypothetical protein